MDGAMTLRNRTLLGKWLWRFSKMSESSWHKVIQSINGLQPHKWDTIVLIRWLNGCPCKVFPWCYHDFSYFSYSSVGDGSKSVYGKIYDGGSISFSPIS